MTTVAAPVPQPRLRSLVGGLGVVVLALLVMPPSVTPTAARLLQALWLTAAVVVVGRCLPAGGRPPVTPVVAAVAGSWLVAAVSASLLALAA